MGKGKPLPKKIYVIIMGSEKGRAASTKLQLGRIENRE